MTRTLPPILGLLALSACNQAPTGGAVTIEPAFPDTRAELVARVSTPAVDPDGDEVEYLYEWRVNGERVDDLTQDTVPADRTERDEVWTVSVVASDGRDLGPELTDEVTIVNAAPTVQLSISPTEPRGDDDLVASVVRQDADDDIVDVAWTWSVDGVERAGLTEARVPASETARGQVWEVKAQPSDRFGVGPSSTASVEIRNAPPVVVEPSLEPEEAYTNSAFLARASATDEEGDRVNLTFHWVRDGVDLGLTGPTLDPAQTAKGDAISVRIVANDGFDDSDPVTVGPITVRNSPPTAPGVNIMPGTGEDDLYCEIVEESADLDGDAVSYTFEWTVDGSRWAGSTLTTRYAGDTIALEDLEVGQEWTCTVTATDGESSAEPVQVDAIVGGGNVTFRNGYYWVIADHRAARSEHASICASAGLVATDYQVTLTWDSALLSDLATDFGYTSVGDVNNSARSMWCYEAGSSYPTGTGLMTCETHNFGTYYENYGYWGSYANQRPVFTCTR